MIISLSTNHWLFSHEKLSLSKNMLREKTTVTTSTQPTSTSTTSSIIPINSSNNNAIGDMMKKLSKNISVQVPNLPKYETTTKKQIVYVPTDYFDANYGLWRMCKIMGLLEF